MTYCCLNEYLLPERLEWLEHHGYSFIDAFWTRFRTNNVKYKGENALRWGSHGNQDLKCIWCVFNVGEWFGTTMIDRVFWQDNNSIGCLSFMCSPSGDRANPARWDMTLINRISRKLGFTYFFRQKTWFHVCFTYTWLLKSLRPTFQILVVYRKYSFKPWNMPINLMQTVSWVNVLPILCIRERLTEWRVKTNQRSTHNNSWRYTITYPSSFLESIPNKTL